MLKPLAIGMAFTCCVPAVLRAQHPKAEKEAQAWSLQGLREGYCVRFLVEPRAASKEVKSGFRPVPANQDLTLHPAIQQLIRYQPDFAAWSASNVCFYFSDAVQVGSHRVAEKNPRNRQMLAVWTLPTQEGSSGARRDAVLGVYSGRGNLIRAAETAGVKLREAHVSVVDSADSGTDIYSIKLEQTSLIWRGRPAGDSTQIDRPIEESWSSVPGTRTGAWSVRFSLRPTSSRGLVGSLTVQGKGDLTKWLKGSPIRFVGPLYRGGAGELQFLR
jgi:hypothetical protein